MQKDLENLAKEMQMLKPDDRLYWLRSLAQCRENARPSVYPVYQSFNQVEADFLHFKSTLIWTMSSILASGKKKKTLIVKKGINAFMSAFKEERDEFYKAVLQKETPSKIAVKSAHTSSRRKEERIHE